MFTVLAIATHMNSKAGKRRPRIRFGSSAFPGDIVLGGVFPVHSKGSLESGKPCGEISETRGVHRVEAMLYAIDRINEQSDFLRGYKLGALILDSCSNPSYALNQSLILCAT
ncbi:ANF-receptor domain-containing protein [Aphelenchoides fujianensis]|nr:ANF-receptor domain-containing protein [Aphelenchoides fujianensis]